MSVTVGRAAGAVGERGDGIERDRAEGMRCAATAGGAREGVFDAQRRACAHRASAVRRHATALRRVAGPAPRRARHRARPPAAPAARADQTEYDLPTTSLSFTPSYYFVLDIIEANANVQAGHPVGQVDPSPTSRSMALGKILPGRYISNPKEDEKARVSVSTHDWGLSNVGPQTLYVAHIYT